MKRLIAIFIMIFVLCSCGKAEDLPKYPSEIPEIKKIKTEENVFVSDEPENESVKQILKMFEAENLNSESKIILRPEGIELLENNIFSYVLVAEKGEKTFSVPAKGMLYYNDDEYAFSLDADSRIKAFWGNFAFVDEDTAAFLTLGKIFLMNTETLAAEGTIVLPESENANVWPVGIAFSEKTGYLVPLCEMPDDGSKAKSPGRIVSFDKNLEFSCEFPAEKIETMNWHGINIPYISQNSSIYFYKGETYLWNTNLYRLSDGKVFGFSRNNRFPAGGYEVSFLTVYSEPTEEFFAKENEYAFLRKGSDIIKTIPIDEKIYFGYGENGMPLAEFSFSENDKKAVIKDSFYYRDIVLDFEKSEYEISYSYSENDISSAFAVSPNKKYSLHEAAFSAGGDGYMFDVVLKDIENKTLSYLCAGGMGVNCGFFNNGEIYCQDRQSLKIYSPKTGEIIFDIEENFSLETELFAKEEIELLTFRRNPEDFSFVILYWEGSTEGFYDEKKAETIPHYKIGYLDSEGKLIKSFESDIPVALGMHCWPQDAVFYYENGIYTVTTLGSKGSYGINFTFDTKTETFSKAFENKDWIYT